MNGGGGGSAGLNFTVIGGTTEPTSPSENMIWVNTSTTITSWTFSPNQPTGSEGMVWFMTNTSSPINFNALEKKLSDYLLQESTSYFAINKDSEVVEGANYSIHFDN